MPARTVQARPTAKREAPRDASFTGWEGVSRLGQVVVIRDGDAGDGR